MGKQLKTFKSEFIDYHKNIMIPLLQRDYVQGGRLDVISPLLDELISALSTTDKKVNLNYIYGYDHETKFVPIDGQQRLITLWLLHLYIYARLQKDFKVGLQFESREFAHNFCEKLPEKLGDFLKEKKQEKESDSSQKQNLKEKIVDSDWFVFGWQQDTTVENMLKTLQLIDDKLRGKAIGNVHEDNIGFDFKKLENGRYDETKGLNDDIYVKMNGRGRPLSYFENLKSWMDKQVQTLFGKENEFTKQWQSKMDNAWTDLFWDNRNKNKEKPEEIDDERLRYLYSMLLLHWIQDDNNSCFLESFRANEGESQEDVKSGYIAFLNEWRHEEDKLPENANAEHLRERTFSLLQKGDKMIPLYWIEKINIFGNKEVFKFISESLDTLTSISGKINGIRENFVKSLDFDNKSSVLYQIAFKEATYNKTLPLLYALVNSAKEESESATSFFDWMRVMRNLILGTDIRKDNISKVLKSIQLLSALCREKNIYKLLLTEDIIKKTVSGFIESQVEEEIRKAQWIVEDNEWVEVFNELESIAFCKGTINFIFNFLPEKKNKQIFKEYSTLFHLLFGGTGPRNTIPDYYLQRSLMCFTTHYGFGFWYGEKWKFMNDRSLWHKFLNDSEECEGQSHNQCVKSLVDYLYKDFLSDKLDLSHYSEEYTRRINCKLLSIINNTNNIEDWRYFFIKYPSIWSEMKESMCCWENEYNIVLLHRTQNRDKSKSELRSYAFWQDVLSDRDKNPNDYTQWSSPKFFKERDTCMYINHTCNSKRVVAIDLFYERGKADQYRFRLFFRPNEFEESEKTYLATFEELKDIAKKHCFEFKKEDHRYYSQHYSCKDAMKVFKELLKELGEI
ncbi:MAG: DUF262 domain-containing protein [Bacteroidales bacterium]|nr:DUF262 domain-containing protein [Bacteroidales bacterium]